MKAYLLLKPEMIPTNTIDLCGKIGGWYETNIKLLSI